MSYRENIWFEVTGVKMKQEKIYNPHGKSITFRECIQGDLIIVSEGVQCSNCLVLVINNRGC